MGQIAYDPSSIVQVKDANIAILCSKWYSEYVQSMCDACTSVLQNGGAQAVATHTLPGCLELPLAARKLLQVNKDLEAIIVFGVILKGDTYHFDVVKDMCMDGLQRVMFEFDVPIINEILPVSSIDQVQARTADNTHNKGYEAGIAALEVIAWRRSIVGA